MRNLTKAILLVMVLLSVLLSLQACGTTIEPGQRGVRWNPLTGGLSPEPLKSGFYWRAPWNQIYLYNVRWRSYTETIDALSSDDLPVTLKTVVVIRPIPEELYFLAKEIGPDFYPRVAKRELLAAVRSVVSNYPMATVLEHSSEIASEVEAVVVEKLKDRHVQVASVAMAGLDPEYLRFKLYDSSHSKWVLLPDKQNVPLLINPGTDQATTSSHEDFGVRH
jgi:regulator of protease activity HflC (stomatin/prohibitin superfamily)